MYHSFLIVRMVPLYCKPEFVLIKEHSGTMVPVSFGLRGATTLQVNAITPLKHSEAQGKNDTYTI